MIRQVVLRRFKRFEEVTFDLSGHVVLAGPNNTGKTTVLQALAAWKLALERWRVRNDFGKHRGAYAKQSLMRSDFYAVPLRGYDLLWNERKYGKAASIEIEVEFAVQGAPDRSITMELLPDTSDQIYVRPTKKVAPESLREVSPSILFVPPMTGLSTDEPVYQPPKIRQLLGQGKPGDVIRNLLVEAYQTPDAWSELQKSIRGLFNYILMPPNAEGAKIIAEYLMTDDGPRFDIASAGSGFQQVLMLLTFLHTRPASVLLLDEPDAHLHVILQDAIYSKLRSAAQEQNSQLIIATHSEVVINSVEPREIFVLFDYPRQLSSVAERDVLRKALGSLTHMDITLALIAPGVLYLEDYTDFDILREWAQVLRHPSYTALTDSGLWKPNVTNARPGSAGVRARDHYEALKLVRSDLPGIELIDGDAHPNIQSTKFEPGKLQRLRWQRYEIESYLVHPAALERFVENKVGPAEISAQARADMMEYLEKTFTPEFVANPLQEHPLVEAYLKQTKAREKIIPPILNAAGLIDFPYTRYNEIAAIMLPEEIHPEVIEKLDAIQEAFGL